MLNEIAKCHMWVTWKSLPLTGTLILKWRWYWNHPKTSWWFQGFYIFTRDMIQFQEHIFQMGWFNHQLERTSRNIYNLGVGFKYFLFSTRKLGKISNLTSIFFQTGWFNHQPVVAGWRSRFWYENHENMKNETPWIHPQTPILLNSIYHLFIYLTTMGTQNLHFWGFTTHIFWGCKTIIFHGFGVQSYLSFYCLSFNKLNLPK